MTKNGKPYENVILQDKTGVIDGKIWEPNSQGIDDFDAMDYVEIVGEVTNYLGTLQVNIKRARKCSEGEYNPADYQPVSAYDIEEMYEELLEFVHSIKNEYVNRLARSFFEEDAEFIKAFKSHSAAKSVHHGFIGGLLEHTLSVVKLCRYYTTAYPMLNYDLLIASALFHDIAKTRELAAFPANDYTDEGQLLGHIVLGTQMVAEKAAKIPDFPPKLLAEIEHCILAHHGEYEYGSPKKPALAEAVALNFADNTDAKLETMKEILDANKLNDSWFGYNRLFESNLRKSSEY
jgi:3'-5' exoribonuclease